tara:strand:- start:606 stop:1592 length:987 start_codon:yes stop_codon:yes gene_type:complete
VNTDNKALELIDFIRSKLAVIFIASFCISLVVVVFMYINHFDTYKAQIKFRLQSVFLEQDSQKAGTFSGIKANHEEVDLVLSHSHSFKLANDVVKLYNEQVEIGNDKLIYENNSYEAFFNLFNISYNDLNEFEIVLQSKKRLEAQKLPFIIMANSVSLANLSLDSLVRKKKAYFQNELQFQNTRILELEEKISHLNENLRKPEMPLLISKKIALSKQSKLNIDDINEIIAFHISAQKSKMENWMSQINDLHGKKSEIGLIIKRLELVQDSIAQRKPQIVSYKLEHKLSLLSMFLVMIFSFAINVVFFVLSIGLFHHYRVYFNYLFKKP